MNVGNIHGAGGVERGRGRPVDAEPREAKPRASDGPTNDTASISRDGRETLAAIDQLSERARHSEDRTSVVEAARARLASGALDDPEVFRAAARAMLG